MQSPLIPAIEPFRIAIDTNVLMRELLHERGRALLADPLLDTRISARAWSELVRLLPHRVLRYIRGRGDAGVDEERLAQDFQAFAERYLIRVPEIAYRGFEDEARERIPRDADDWPTVALAIALETPIWTNDHDFLGCGVATWTTETLRAHLARHYGVNEQQSPTE